jgi:hypothetical protein
MKKFTQLLVCSCALLSLSGCVVRDAITDYVDTSQNTVQETSEAPGQRVYMDEVKGILQDFTGAALTMSSQEQTYIFDLSEATLECEDGMITGDEISVIYEGQLSSEDTSTVKALKVVDDFHKKNQLEVRKAYGEVQGLTPNTITIKDEQGKTATYPITGTEQYYQGGIRQGAWVYINFKGEFSSGSDGDASLNASHLKVLSVSDIDPLTLPDPTPTLEPTQEASTDVPQEQQLHAAENVGIRHGRKAVGVRRHIREAHIPRHLRDERVRDRALLLHLHRMAGAQALRIARKHSRLRAKDAHMRRERLDGRGHAADEPAAADRDNDRVGLRALGEDLEPDGTLPRHDQLVIERRHHGRTPLGAELRRDCKPLGRIAQHELRPQRADGCLLDGRGRARHDDAGMRAEVLRGIGHRTAMVAG